MPVIDKIKRLEWQKNHGSWLQTKDDWYQAETPFGFYYIFKQNHGAFRIDFHLGLSGLPEFQTVESAKDAAQADFERRVMECLA